MQFIVGLRVAFISVGGGSTRISRQTVAIIAVMQQQTRKHEQVRPDHTAHREAVYLGLTLFVNLSCIHWWHFSMAV